MSADRLRPIGYLATRLFNFATNTGRNMVTPTRQLTIPLNSVMSTVFTPTR